MSGRRHDYYPTSRRDPMYEDDNRRPSRHDRYEYSSSPSNHAYPPPPSKASSYRPSKPRRRWPPPPSVEEEVTALRREAGNTRMQATEEVLQRGTIDQDPIILDVTPPRVSRLPPKADRKVSPSPGEPTPPTSDDDDRLRRARRHGPRLNTAAIPEMRRTPSPYSNSTPTSAPISSRTNPSAISQDRPYSSIRNLSAQPDQPWPAVPKSAGSSTSQRMGRGRSAIDDSRPSSAVVEGGDLGENEANMRRNERRSARYSFNKPISLGETQTIEQDDVKSKPRNARRPLLSDDNRRHTDSFVDVPREQIISQAQKPHTKVANLVREASGQQNPASTRVPSGTPPTRFSPRASTEQVPSYPPSPPRSPRASQDHTREPSISIPKRPQQNSAEASRNNSPQASPRLPTNMPNSAGGWQGAFDNNAARSTRPTTRLATATRPDDYSRTTRAAPPLARAESLPYPIDDFTTSMPEERDHQYFHDGLRPMEPSPMFAKTMSRAGAPLTARPPLPKNASYKDNTTAPTTPTTSLPTRAPKQVSFADPSVATLPIASAAPIMPLCDRDTYVSGYEDWYTLDDCPNFDICSTCLMGNFRDHYHFAFFRPVAPGVRSRDTKVRCDFSRPWLRLAWLLTLQRQLPNLNLVKSIYHYLEHPSTLACPDIHTKPHTWFTVLDDLTRKPIPSLSICRTDVQTIELLLPSLRGFFVPLPSAKGSRSSSTTDTSSRLCTFRSTNNNRFPIYLDFLISLHETALQQSSRALPDMTPFVHLVKHKLAIDECPRDNILQGAKWFFIPSLPEFTVCEDCYDDAIVPHLRQDRDLVMRFNRKAELLSTSKEGRSARDSVSSITDVAREASCALYSARMRAEFVRAVDNNDLRALARVARARRDMEVELQRKAQPVIAKIGEVDEALIRAEDRGETREARRLEDEREALERKLRTLQARWKEVE